MLTTTFNGYKVHLIQQVEELDKIKSLLDEHVYVGCDTETSGLDWEKDSIAGVCISAGHSYSTAHYHGFYIPVDHIGYSGNLPKKPVIAFIQYVIDNYTTTWWNRDYDATMLEKEGILFPCVGKTHDIQCMAHLIKGDSLPALKDFSEDYLKFNVMHYSDNNAEEGSFKTTDPTVSYVYAAGDPILTALLGRKIWSEYPHIRKIYPLDNKFAESMRLIMKNTQLYLDKDLVKRELDKNAVELQQIKAQIFAFVGYQFKLDSTQDKAEALSRYVTLTVKTDKGKYKVDKEVLQGIDHPLAKMLLKYAKLTKFRSTYLKKMIDFPEGFRINYQHCNVSTGRLSSGTSKGNDFFVGFNIQNVPKTEMMRQLHYAPISSPIRWYVDDNPLKHLPGWLQIETSSGYCTIDNLKPGTIVKTSKGDREVISVSKYTGKLQCMEGVLIRKTTEWETSDVVEDSGYQLDCGDDCYSVKTSLGDVQIRTLSVVKCKGGMRDCFIPPEGYVWISCDYSSEEVVMLANLSKEPVLLEPLKQGLDIHKFVATKMFGHYDPSHRTVAKTITFAANYGGTGYTIAKRLGLPQKEGEALLDKYNKTLKKATAWKEASIREGRRKGLVFTYFGRPRAVWMYYASSDKGMHGFADRTCMNSPIQGAGGDIIRMDYIKFSELYDPRSPHYNKEFAENTKHALTVHDEANFFVKPEYLKKALEVVQGVMNIKMPNWEVGLKVSPSVGLTWGTNFDIKGFDENGVVVPDVEVDLSLLG